MTPLDDGLLFLFHALFGNFRQLAFVLFAAVAPGVLVVFGERFVFRQLDGHWVVGDVVDAHFVVQVAAGAHAAVAETANSLAARDFLSGFNVEVGEMGVAGLVAVSVVNDDDAAIATAPARVVDDAVAGSRCLRAGG